MPTFTFTSPEGKSYSVSGPDGATKETAFQMLQTHLAPDGAESDDEAAPMATPAQVGPIDLQSYIAQQRAPVPPPMANRNALPDMGGIVTPQNDMPPTFTMSPLSVNYDYVTGQHYFGAPTAPSDMPSLDDDNSSGFNIPMGQRGQATINADPSYKSLDLMRRIGTKGPWQLYGQGGVDSSGDANANLILNRNF